MNPEMSKDFTRTLPLREFPLIKKFGRENRTLASFDLEITARCNNSCRHCNINLPALDEKAIKEEMPLKEILEIADEAISLGAVWCLITGGEPLLRDDFLDIYLGLRKRGLLITLFTNATLFSDKHIKLLRKYPPRLIEVTVYGVTESTYERVTRVQGSYWSFHNGLMKLIKEGLKVRLKTMAIQSNLAELPEIISFCVKYTRDFVRWDPFLKLRYDRNINKNNDIRLERIPLEEIIRLEKSDTQRYAYMKNICNDLILAYRPMTDKHYIFYCAAGVGNFSLGYNGIFRLCPSLWHPDCVYNLRKGNLTYAWRTFVPIVRKMQSDCADFLKNCHKCNIVNLCMWCPAQSYLETGNLDSPVDLFCKIAHSRSKALEE